MSDAAAKRHIMANKGNKEEFMDSLDHDSGFRSKDNITGSFRSSFNDTSVASKRGSTESRTTSSIEWQSPESFSCEAKQDADLPSNQLSTSKSPQKRKLKDENCFSPKTKNRKENNRAILILKEKSYSENIIASTPKRGSFKLWDKFNSFHPSSETFGSIDQEEEQIPIQTIAFQIPKTPALGSLGKFHNSYSEAFDSFDFSTNFDHTDQTSDSKLNSLFSGAICDDFDGKISGSAALDQILESPQHMSFKIHSVIPVKKNHCMRASSSFIPSKLEVINEVVSKDEVIMLRRKVDILEKFPGKNNLCLDLIIDKLEDPDLLSMCMVSKRWNEIVMENKKASLRRLEYLKVREASKENKLSSLNEKKDGIKSVKAFNVSSGNVLQAPAFKYRSPPVSPSKRKFHENQKIVSKTSPSTKIIKCPTCERPALVKSTRIPVRRRTSFKRKLKKKQKRGDVSNTFQKQDSLKKSLFSLNDSTSSSGSAASGNSSPGSAGSPTNSDLDDSGCVTSGQKQPQRKDYEYAVCQGCKFKFCTKCKLENHPSKQCNFTPTTPPKNHNKSVACSKDSRKSLRRL